MEILTKDYLVLVLKSARRTSMVQRVHKANWTHDLAICNKQLSIYLTILGARVTLHLPRADS